MNSHDMEAEERVIAQYILCQSSWENLPQPLQRALQSKENWKREVLRFSLRYQLRWKENLVRFFLSDERAYYEEIVRLSIDNHLVYPYHLSDVLMKGLKVTAKFYYQNVVHSLTQKKISLSEVLQVTVMDCCRVLCVDPSELAALLQQSKEPGFRQQGTVADLKISKNHSTILHWWIAHVGLILEDDIANCGESEHAVVDSLIVRGSTLAGELDKEALYTLSKKDLIYFEVPIYNDDVILLNESMTLKDQNQDQNIPEELAFSMITAYLHRVGEATLQDIAYSNGLDVNFSKRAVSLFCRLNVLQKRTPSLTERDDTNSLQSHSIAQTKWHSSWINAPPTDRLAELTDDVTIKAILEQIKKASVEERGKVDENKLWDILNFIENWQRTRDTSSVQYQQLLTEVKATLLPLIPQTGALGGEPTTMLTSYYGVPENELARFDDHFKLVVNEANWSRLLATANKKQISNIVAVCGDTHVGKSTLISSLLKETQTELQVKPEVAAPNQNSPTTAHIQFYDSNDTIENLSRIRYLDLEGENGGKPPRNALSEKLEALLGLLGITEYQQRRRKAVSENMPRLGFVTSDVIVFVWNESFANASYMNRVRKLVNDATESVDSASAPALILIYNKCSLDEEFDIDKCTAQFFENEENLEIKKLYSTVKTLCIPHLDQVKKVKAPGRPTLLIDGEEIYALQIQKLHKLIQDLLSQRMRLREQEGLLYSEYVWCLLFRTVLDRFDRKLRMAEILCSIVKPRELLAVKAFDFFRETYAFAGIRNKQRFLECRESAFQMLACLFVDHMRAKQEEYDKWIINTMKSLSFKQELERVFSDLYVHLRNLEPCECIFPQEGGNSRIFCTTERMVHGLYHRSSEKVFGASADPQALVRIYQNIKAWLKIGYKPVWEGMHQFTYPESYQTELNIFVNTIQMLSKTLASNYFLTRISIMQKAINSSPNNSSSNNTDSGFCWICLTGLADVMLSPCKHVYCSGCILQLSKVTRDQVGLSLEALSLHEHGGNSSLATREVLSTHCPICDERIGKVEKNTGTMTKLKDRLVHAIAH
eukprot:TRINITY_DN3976_c0_g1_i1.p1 TRINITY_DN3976_c0_g1~~TRINITY_DN3976_c0_g1_i1.p1  ORF type:complete len:1053 (+),score=230.57 TRINITY_DN3976_c0_g1_i1:184-3342(+)